ncbi:MAG: DUF998 domain-containing protein [Planctomycetota bacterium]
MSEHTTKRTLACCGLTSVATFLISFCVFGALDDNFDWVNDYISKLGSRGQPNALAWNLFGFAVPGFSLAVFGWFRGVLSDDRLLGGCLVVAGLGFAAGAIPADLTDNETPFSKAHFVAICVSLAGWFFGLARLTRSTFVDETLRRAAQIVTALTFVPLLALGVDSELGPVAHRVLLVVIFGWVALVSARELFSPSPARRGVE